MKSLFYRPIKLTNSLDTVFFWSDTHFNHRCERWAVPLWKSRGFSSVEEHTEGLIDRWNSKVSQNSIVFHLGDFVLGFNSITAFKSIIKRLNFKDLYIMPGNHNSGWKQAFEEQKGNIWYLSPTKRVIFIPNYAELFVDDLHFILSHYPILSFNSQSSGSICVYGHVHGNLERNEIGKLYKQARTVEVTVDVAASPLSVRDILQKIPDRSVSFDHHLNNTIEVISVA